MAESEDKAEAVESIQTALDYLRKQRADVDQAIFEGEKWLARVQGIPALEPSRPASSRRGKTNAAVLEELLLAAEPNGLLVSELVQRLKQEGHRLARASDPVKATSNELAGMRGKRLVYKDKTTGKYRVTKGAH